MCLLCQVVSAWLVLSGVRSREGLLPQGFGVAVEVEVAEVEVVNFLV